MSSSQDFYFSGEEIEAKQVKNHPVMASVCKPSFTSSESQHSYFLIPRTQQLQPYLTSRNLTSPAGYSPAFILQNGRPIDNMLKTIHKSQAMKPIDR